MQAVLECKQCGGVLSPEEGQKIVYCKFCGSANSISFADRFGMYNRANYLRRQNEFDRALGVYEDIIKEDSTDAEGYYGIALCKYGIEYVDDPKTGEKIPTCHRTRLTLISQDADFKKALEYADVETQQVYLAEAARIDTILKKIQMISSKQEKYDVFICYKEGDGQGGRTNTSVLAQDIYENLTNRGYKVFFARKTLESKLGSDYEPVIFSALYSAKVMLVIGTNREEFQGIWVRNEWVRFIERISSGEECTLIPIYKDMSPYELPNEMANIQALDMSKIGFMQDLLDAIGKLIRKKQNYTQEASYVPTGEVNTGNISGLRKRAYLFLEQSDFTSAGQYFERVLDQNPEDSESYWGKLLIQLECRQETDLENVDIPISDSQNYQLALRFANEEQAKKYKYYSDLIDTRLYEELKKKEEEERERQEKERREAEERTRAEAEKRKLEEEQRIAKLEAKKQTVKKFKKKLMKLIIAFVIYTFIGQFLLMGIGNMSLKLLGEYRAAYNYVWFMRSIPLFANIQDLPGFSAVADFCGKEPEYSKYVDKWCTGEISDEEQRATLSGAITGWVPVGCDDEFFVSVDNGKVVVSFVGDKNSFGLRQYIIAKQLYAIRDQGNRIRNIYATADNWHGGLLILYENGDVKYIHNNYYHRGITWKQEGPYIENKYFDYSVVEQWKDIKALKESSYPYDGYIYGLKENGEIIVYSLWEGIDLGWHINWNKCESGLYPMVKDE